PGEADGRVAGAGARQGGRVGNGDRGAGGHRALLVREGARALCVDGGDLVVVGAAAREAAVGVGGRGGSEGRQQRLRAARAGPVDLVADDRAAAARGGLRPGKGDARGAGGRGVEDGGARDGRRAGTKLVRQAALAGRAHGGDLVV